MECPSCRAPTPDCRLHDLSRDGSTYFLTMEYVSGEDLKSMIAMSGQLGAGTANGLEPSVPRELFRLPAGPFGYSPYDVPPDGRRCLVLTTPEHAAPQPLTVIVNWPALLQDGNR